MKRRCVGIWLFVFLAATPARAEKQATELVVRGDRAEVAFLAIGKPSALKIRGVMKDDPAKALTGSFKLEKYKMTGQVDLKLDSLSTGIGLRDRHMKEEYLETGTYPIATFRLDPLRVPIAFPESPFEVNQEPFTGSLELHGIKKDVKGMARMDYDEGVLELALQFDTNVSDFKIAVPSFAGVTVADRVNVDASVKLKVGDKR